MRIREAVTDFAKGDFLGVYWKLFGWHSRISCRLLGDVVSFFLYRMAHRHGGYIGRGAVFQSPPLLPHGLHGIYVSRYAKIGRDCRIYQNVTIGSIGRQAPQIGDHCFIGAGAIIAGNVRVGDFVKIGAGAVVHTDIPSHATVVSQPARVIVRGAEDE